MVRGGPKFAALALFFLGARCLRAQSETPPPAATPTPTSAPASAEAVTPAPTPAAGDSRAMIDALGACVESGRLNVEIDFVNGAFPSAPKRPAAAAGPPKDQ
jgi:hypothetical protein